MGVKYIVLWLLVPAAVLSDLRTYKIKNSIHIVFVFTGLILNFYYSGIAGAREVLLSVLLPVVLLFPLFALRMLGAGDIKLLGSIGAVMGFSFVAGAMLYSFLCGGVIALVLIAVRKNGMERVKHIAGYMKSCFLTLSLLPYTDFSDKTDGAKFRFSCAIALGVVLQCVLPFIPRPL